MASYGTALKKIYGSTAATVKNQLIAVTLDWPKGDGKSAQKVVVYVHKKNMAARLRNVNIDMKSYCKAHGVGYTITPPVGCFAWRAIRGSLTGAMSMHSGAIAIDINPSKNPMTYGKLITNIPSWMVNIFKANGFTWGGSWLTRKDAMHFELRVHTEPTPKVVKSSKPPVPKPKVMPILRAGSKDTNHVKLLQLELNTHRMLYPLRKRILTGWSVLKKDGDFGPKTTKAVKAFQKLAHLVIDGEVGPKTWKALGH